MEYNKYNSKREKKVDIFLLHTSLGGVELLPSTPERTLVMDCLYSDLTLESVSCFQLGQVPGAGRFFDIGYAGRIFTLHETVIPILYRIENFVVKRNYYCSDANTTTAASSPTQGASDHSAELPPFRNQPGGRDDEYHQSESPSHTYDRSKEGHQRWSDMEEDVSLMDLAKNDPNPGMNTGKPVNDIKFFQKEFLDELPKLGQSLVPYSEFVSRNKYFEKRDFYLFDFVALFTDFTSVFEGKHPKSSYIKSKLVVLDEISRGPMAFMPLQSPDNGGWNSMIKFLCQSLNGEYQISFLRVVIFFLVRKIATNEQILQSKMDVFLTTFLTGDESVRNDCSRVIRINVNALMNNQKVLIDKNYAFNCMTEVSY